MVATSKDDSSPDPNAWVLFVVSCQLSSQFQSTNNDNATATATTATAINLQQRINYGGPAFYQDKSH